MQNMPDGQKRSNHWSWGVAAVIMFALALAAGCGDAASDNPAATAATVSPAQDTDKTDAGVNDGHEPNALTIRPVSSSEPSGQGQDCSANAQQDESVDAPLTACGADGDEVFDLAPAIITGNGVKSAQPSQDQAGSYIVMLEFTSDAEQALQAFTRDHEGSALAFVVDGTVLFAPVMWEVQSPIMVAGNFSESEARDLADLLS